MGTRGLELGVARVEEEASAKEEDESGPYIKTPNTKRIRLGIETYLSPESCTQRMVGLTTLALMKIPGIREHDLCLDKTSQ